MREQSLHSLLLAGFLVVGASSVASAQSGTTNVVPGHAPGAPVPAPSVDTNGAGAVLNRADGSRGPGTTGSTMPAKDTATIPPDPEAAIQSGASGRNNCYPGQSGRPVGSSYPSGMPSQC